MKKEDILKRAQKEKYDERENQINIKAFHIGWIVTSIAMLPILFLRFIYNESAIDLVFIIMVHSSASLFYQYSKTSDKKSYLIYGLIALIGAILGFAALLSSYGVY